MHFEAVFSHQLAFFIMVLVRYLISVFCLCTAVVPTAYAQRVYASTEQHSAKLSATVLFISTTFSEVTNPTLAVDGDDNTSSNLFVSLGVLGLIDAWQNAQFTPVKPTAKSPVIVQFTAINSSATVLDLLGGVALQTTNNNGSAITSRSGSELLNLLGIFSSGSIKTVILPAPDQTYDGVRLSISAVLATAINAKYYYAFFVKPPTISNVTVCSGQGALLTVTNVQSGYQYKWYTQETGGTALATTTGGTYTTTPVTSATSYYVEAMDSGVYPSARTRVDISVLPKPSTPLVHLNN